MVVSRFVPWAIVLNQTSWFKSVKEARGHLSLLFISAITCRFTPALNFLPWMFLFPDKRQFKMVRTWAIVTPSCTSKLRIQILNNRYKTKCSYFGYPKQQELFNPIFLPLWRTWSALAKLCCSFSHHHNMSRAQRHLLSKERVYI